jgi:type IV secretion system protein VirB8
VTPQGSFEQMERARAVRGWTVAIAAASVAAIQATGLALLFPLATPAPLVAQADGLIGPAQNRQRLEHSALSRSPLMVRAELARYVARREGLSPLRLAADHRAVALASSGEARTAYLAEWAPDGPRTRGATRDTRIAISVTSVTLTSPTTAEVRFEARRTDADQEFAGSTQGVAQMTFGFDERALTPLDRLFNPLGLVVQRYQVSG